MQPAVLRVSHAFVKADACVIGLVLQTSHYVKAGLKQLAPLMTRRLDFFSSTEPSLAKMTG